MNAKLLILLASVCLVNSEPLTKLWSKGLTWSSQRAWTGSRLPCGNQRITLPKEGVIFLDTSTYGREIVLPKDGALVFLPGSSIGKNGAQSSCSWPNGEAIYSGNQVDDNYLDPSSWSTTVYGVKYDGGATTGNPMPHTERVPCPSDSIKFPDKSAFKVSLKSTAESTVASLYIGSKQYTNEQFKRLLQMDIGSKLFTKSESSVLTVEASRATCPYVQGCPSRNDKPEIMSLICSNVAGKCPKLTCANPVRPIGFCCKICGSFVSLVTKEDSFRFELLDSLLLTYRAQKDYAGVNSYLHLTNDRTVQIIFVDSVQGHNRHHKMAAAFAEYLQEDMTPGQPNLYSLTALRIVTSGSEDGSHTGIIFVAILFFILAVLVGVYYHHSGGNMSLEGVQRFGVDIYHWVRIRLPSRPVADITASDFNFIRFREGDERLELGLELGNQDHMAGHRWSS
ncbi:Protein amnionless [Halotydeus destructor]|nr:Protein amnionless [Halotydeus destructor]